jgi:hypothetical protein
MTRRNVWRFDKSVTPELPLAATEQIIGEASCLEDLAKSPAAGAGEVPSACPARVVRTG